MKHNSWLQVVNHSTICYSTLWSAMCGSGSRCELCEGACWHGAGIIQFVSHVTSDPDTETASCHQTQNTKTRTHRGGEALMGRGNLGQEPGSHGYPDNSMVRPHHISYCHCNHEVQCFYCTLILCKQNISHQYLQSVTLVLNQSDKNVTSFIIPQDTSSLISKYLSLISLKNIPRLYCLFASVLTLKRNKVKWFTLVCMCQEQTFPAI